MSHLTGHATSTLFFGLRLDFYSSTVESALNTDVDQDGLDF